MVKCCIVGCRSSSKHSLTSGVRLHRFPTKNQSLRRKWIKFVLLAGTKISKLDISDRNNTRICSEHFPNHNRDENPVPSVLPDGRQLASDLPIGSSEANFMSELEMEDLEEKGGTYEFEQDADLSLEDFIDAKLGELDLLSLIDKAADNLDIKLRQQERKTREVNQIFSHCESQMKLFKFNIEQSQGIDRFEDPAVGGSDSDDDVQFVQAGFDPQLAVRHLPQRHPTPNQRMGIPTSMQQNFTMRGGMMVRKGQFLQASAGFAQAFSPRPGIPGLRTPSPRLPSPRFISAGQPGVRYQGVRAPGPRYAGVQKTVQDGGIRGAAPLEGAVPIQPRRPHTTMYAPQTKHADLVVGMKLYGQKFNDIWYKGTLTEIHNKEKPRTEWRYRIKFDGKGMKVLPGKQVAFADTPKDTLPVGSRVVALYKDEDTSSANAHYAGIVAESPSLRNNQRYLIFFDDGYAQYCYDKEIHKVYEQSRNVWEDIHPDSQEFIKSYLKQYPERPMVRLQQGQIIKTEWNGRWWTARVLIADASLVKMYFDADKRVEWIYRGSTRLEPLYTELANAEMFKHGKGHRRHNIGGIKGSKKPIVEYVRGTDEDYMKRKQPNQWTKNRGYDAHGFQRSSSADSLSGPKRRPVARKSVSKQQPQFATGDVVERRHHFQASSISRNNVVARDLASVLQDRLAGDYGEFGEGESLGERMEIDRGLTVLLRKPFKQHSCCPKCLDGTEKDPTKFRGNNPLIIPMLCGWERQISRQKNTGRRVVFYRAPCARRLRTLDEVIRYLNETDSELTIDYFCYDVNLHTHSEFVPIKTFCDIKDLSYGKETVRISCVNGIDRQYPDYVEYSNQRIPAEGVHLNLDTDFLMGCDCKDGDCGDPEKCACARLTFEASKTVSIFHRPEFLGYRHRRLLEPITSGIYECNQRCKCDHRCGNRVAQNGLQLRLQVFKTEKRGWGLRSLDDIPAGGFICVYAGQLLTEQGANEDGQQYGDEYLAELDYIEVVERCKDGYESDVDINLDAEEETAEQTQSEPKSDSEEEVYHDSDSTFSGEKYVSKGNPAGTPKRESSRRRKEKEAEKESGDARPTKLVIKRGADQEKTWSVKVKSPQAKTKEWVDSIPDPMMIVISDEEDGAKGSKSEEAKAKSDGENEKVNLSDEEEEKNKESEKEEGKEKNKEDEEKEEGEKQKGGDKNDSDLDSIGERKLDKPHTLSQSKVTLKLKSKVFSTGDVKVDANSVNPSRRPLRVPRIRERGIGCTNSDKKTDKDSEKNSEADGPSSVKSAANKEETKKSESVDGSDSSEGSKKNSQKMTRSKSRDKEKLATEGSTKEGTDNDGDKAKKQTTSRQSRFSGLPDPKSQQMVSPLKLKVSKEDGTVEKVPDQPKKKEKKKEPAPAPDEEDNVFNTRLFYNNEDFCYVMDAKSIGNIGRYLNHSCGPNVFVQNVFVDTHDLRFPWVAFFAGQYIRAGTELTWDYNYEVGSVPGKILYCYCGAAECRGRLL